MDSLQGRRAWVSGANRGIGLEVARQLAAAGAQVLALGRNAEAIEAAAASLSSGGLAVQAAVVDVSDPASVAALFAAHPEGPEVLVNNAGLIDEPVAAWEQSLEDWHQVLGVNLNGPFYLCRHALPRMRAAGFGRVINVSSGMGAFEGEAEPNHVAYRVSKAGLNMLTLTLSAEAGPGVLVNAMCPGWVRTDMGGENAPRQVEEGADTALYLAALPDDGPKGQFFRDRKPIAW